MITNRMLSDVCARLGEGVGSARALVDDSWVQMSLLSAEADAQGRVALNFGLPANGTVTRVQLFGADGALWDDRTESFEASTALAGSTLYRLTYVLGAAQA